MDGYVYHVKRLDSIISNIETKLNLTSESLPKKTNSTIIGDCGKKLCYAGQNKVKKLGQFAKDLDSDGIYLKRLSYAFRKRLRKISIAINS